MHYNEKIKCNHEIACPIAEYHMPEEELKKSLEAIKDSLKPD